MKAAVIETENGIVNKIEGAGVIVIVLQGRDESIRIGMFCGIDRVEVDIKFACTTFKLIDQQGGDMQAMMLSV